MLYLFLICVSLLLISIITWVIVWSSVRRVRVSEYRIASSYKKRYDKWKNNNNYDNCPTSNEIKNLYKEIYPHRNLPERTLHYFVNPEAGVPINPDDIRDKNVDLIKNFPIVDSIDGVPVISGTDIGSNLGDLKLEEENIVNNMAKDSKSRLEYLHTPMFKIDIIIKFVTILNDVLLINKNSSSKDINIQKILYIIYQIISIGGSLMPILYKLVNSVVH